MRWTLLSTALVGLLLLAGDRERPAAAALPRIELAGGSLSLRSAPAGQAIFTADNLGPGHSTGGTVSVSNTGTLWGALRLSQTDVTDTPGHAGSALSERLDLLVREMTS